ncbi:MAG TPA: alpha/beta hydrolase [Clostridiales bacterium]|nr:alpha/beta hydrolase [Clostridiales bacterium]
MAEYSKRQTLYSLLGELPDRERPVSSQLVLREEREKYIFERLILDLNGIEPVPAYFLYPKVQNKKVPVILFNHSHGGRYSVGKEELLHSAPYMYPKPYADELTEQGYAVLCIDEWCFGERRGRTESEVFKEMLWKGQVLWGMMVYDSIKAIDYLHTRDDVDTARIGTLGISMGSTKAWWLSALDERVKVCIDICCMTDFHTLIEARGLDGHGVYYYVPGLLKHFTTAQINELICPRPHLSLNGKYDILTPEKGLDIVSEELKKAYAEAGASDKFLLLKYPVAHLETTQMRMEVIKFLNQWL